MFRKLVRTIAVILLVALTFGASPPAPVAASHEVGDNPMTALDLGTTVSLTRLGKLKAGQTFWISAGTLGSGRRVGATIQINPWTAPGPGPLGRPDRLLLQGNNPGENGEVVVWVNLEGTVGKQGKKNVDWTGFTRVGFMTLVNDGGADRGYHQTRPQEATRIYYKLVNNSPEDVVYAFSLDRLFPTPPRGLPAVQGRPKDWGPLPPPWAFPG